MSTFAAIVNRYSFTGDFAASAIDSVGGKDGILEGNASISGNQLVLDGVDDWVSLPSDVLSTYTSASIEAWFTLDTVSTWARLFDFGETSGSSGIYYWFYAPSSGGDSRLVISTTGGEQITSTTILSTATTYHIVCVYDADASQMRLYQNGSLAASTSVTMLLSDVHRVNAYIGKSNYTWDPDLDGSIDEFRIHDSAMTDAQVAVSYAAGPNTIAGSYIAPTNPSPANGSPSQATSLTLSWTSDSSPDITGHHVYLGTDYASVLNATPSSTGIYQGTTAAGTTTFPVTLQIDTQYYWRVEDIVSAGYTLRSSVWAFHTYDPKAINPSPANGTAGIPISGTTLRWTAGDTAASHRVYFGLSPETLQLMEDYYPSTSWPTGVLNYSKTYYWRIDERNSSGTIFTGDVWSLSTMQKPQACIPGDLDGDCYVGIEDLLLFSAQWLANIDCSAYDCPDLDKNQFVDLSDAAILSANWQDEHDPLIVINEIHYHTDNNKQPVEFIELHNAGALQINLGGWKLEDAVDYTFPAGTMLDPGAYVVVSQNPTALTAKFGVSSLGPWTGKLSNEGEAVVLRDAADNKIDEVDYGPNFPWPTAADGEGASMELLNPYLDNDLGGSWRPSGFHYNEYDLAFGAPTPGQINSTYLYKENVPPQTRQVNHAVVNPLTGQDLDEPRTDQSVRVTVKVTDPDGVLQVSLKYQIITAGNYIPAYLPISPISSLIADPFQRKPLNPAFEDAANWTTVAMADNGTNGDAVAGDDIYTAVLSGQNHRTLVRYRIEAADSGNHTVRVPYYDDGTMNFAYFVYDGVPDYIANTDTVQASGAPYTYGTDIMKSLPDYTLITSAADFYQCNGYNSADRIEQATTAYNNQEAGKVYNWEGAFVYDGKVYDHVNYRLRGGNGRYSNGRGAKRSMKFVFNRGNYFQARDIYGDKFPSKWQHLLLGKMLGNWFGYSGYDGYMYGINELINMKLWNIIGIPAPEGYWFTFRVIDNAQEVPNTTAGQYEGDFYGLYLAWEDYDGGFLENHGMPDGNLYKLSDKIYEGYRQSRFQGPDAVENESGEAGSAADYENIRWNMTADATAEFVQNYMDTDEWIRYQTIKESVRHYDVFSGATCDHCLKNSAWYFYPNYSAENNYYGQLWFLPFDVDDTWGPYFNMGVDHGRAAIFDQEYLGGFVQKTVQPAKAPIKQDYRNYLREYRDLFWQPEIIEPMIDELSKKIENIVPADRDRWRLEPGFDDSARSDPGPLDPIVANMKSFAFQPTSVYAYWMGSSINLDNLANAEDDGTNIPNTPTVTYTGQAGYPSNALTFSTSTFSDPQGDATFAASKWRIAEYEDLDTTDTPLPTEIVLIEKEETWQYFEGTQEPSETGLWRQIAFDDSGWLEGTSPIGYDTNLTMGTTLDMRHNYTTIYLRKEFAVTNLSQMQSLQFAILRDDGFKLWINGQLALEENVPAQENLPYTAELADYGLSYIQDELIYKSFEIANPSQYLVTGTNVIAIQMINVSIGGSSDCYADLQLKATFAEPVEQVFKLRKHKFEIQPVWESDDITSASQLTVQIPAGAVKPGKLYRVRSRMKDDTGRWSHWSAPVEFIAGLPLSNGIIDDIRITEVMYNPPQPNTAETAAGYTDNDEFEFIEIKNCSVDETRDLTYVALTNGVTFSFAGSAVTSLAPEEFVLVVKNPTAFNVRYPGLSDRIAGTYSGSLNNGGEMVVLTDSFNGTIADFDYNDGYGWPISTDGAGHSMIPLDSALVGQPYGSLRYCGNWRASTYIKGSPGADDPAPIAGVVINEVMAHTDYTNPLYPDYDSNDWIELYNPTGSSIAYNSNWYLSDNPDNLKKWPLPAGSLAAGGRVSFDEISGFHSPITIGFGLDKTGEYVLLSYLPGTSADRVIDTIKYGGQYNTVSWGRYPDGGAYWSFLANPGTSSNPNAGPIQHPIVISEIMYHPATTTTNDEYIELYNPSTTSAVDLYNDYGTWRLDNAVTYAFPANTSIPAGGRIVVVPFDPAVDTERLAAFNTAYECTLVAGSTVFGPWTGDLSNGGERIALQEPQEADPPSVPTIWWIISDQVIYGDYLPWPISPDGAGMALHRISAAAGACGDNPANWTDGTPSPGN
jgi:hypothetical protein